MQARTQWKCAYSYKKMFLDAIYIIPQPPLGNRDTVRWFSPLILSVKCLFVIKNSDSVYNQFIPSWFLVDPVLFILLIPDVSQWHASCAGHVHQGLSTSSPGECKWASPFLHTPGQSPSPQPQKLSRTRNTEPEILLSNLFVCYFASAQKSLNPVHMQIHPHVQNESKTKSVQSN
jgi:hypothetical protein